jgi:hypothetical protein
VADESLAELIGMDAADPRLTRALVGLGFPGDLVPVIEREQDPPDRSGEGGGSATLDAPARAVRVTFFQAEDVPGGVRVPEGVVDLGGRWW